MFAETIKKCCKERSDEWSIVVQGRIEYFMSDLHAADFIHHRSCGVNFRKLEKTFLSSTNVNKIKKGEGRTTGERRTKRGVPDDLQFVQRKL